MITASRVSKIALPHEAMFGPTRALKRRLATREPFCWVRESSLAIQGQLSPPLSFGRYIHYPYRFFAPFISAIIAETYRQTCQGCFDIWRPNIFGISGPPCPQNLYTVWLQYWGISWHSLSPCALLSCHLTQTEVFALVISLPGCLLRHSDGSRAHLPLPELHM